MEQRVGICSLCGGDVRGYRGPWAGVGPPPPDRCSVCGAYAANEVIEMRRIGPPPNAGLVDNLSKGGNSGAVGNVAGNQIRVRWLAPSEAECLQKLEKWRG